MVNDGRKAVHQQNSEGETVRVGAIASNNESNQAYACTKYIQTHARVRASDRVGDDKECDQHGAA